MAAPYPWLHGTSVDLDCTDAEAERRMFIAQEVWDGRVLPVDPDEPHVVVLGANRWEVRHPLREHFGPRGADSLFDCSLSAWLQSLDVAPREPGRYEAHWSDEHDGWVLTKASDVGPVQHTELPT